MCVRAFPEGATPTLVTTVIVPCVVVPVVDSDGVTETGESSVQLLRQNKLMTQESVRIRKTWVHLRDRQAGESQVERQVRERDRQAERHTQVRETDR